MIKIFLTSRIRKISDSDFLKLVLSEDVSLSIFDNKIETKPFKKLIEFVSDPASADYLMVPHDYFKIRKNIKYLNSVDTLCHRFKKKVIVFAYGNSIERVNIRNSIVLRTSQYKSLLKPNEIIVPPFVEDHGSIHGIEIREFNPDRKPVVGFAGSVFSTSLIQWIRYVVKRYTQFFLVKLKKLHSSAVYEGIHFRRKIITLIKKTNLVDTKLLLEKQYLSNREAKIKKVVSILKHSDFVLSMKGKGNYSSKFFETLSLGRIPVLVDTDIALPLENEIDYDAFILRIDHKDSYDLPIILSKFWKKNTAKKFTEMQNNARQAFKYRLSTTAFYRYLFSNFDDIVNQ